MMGDREKCIQAQMDEYLSKPLQQNHLIQTILKCATLGGQLLEKNRERGLVRQPEANNSQRTVMPETAAQARPSLDVRAFTSQEPLMGSSAESPAPDADQDDTLLKARTDFSDFRSLTG